MVARRFATEPNRAVLPRRAGHADAGHAPRPGSLATPPRARPGDPEGPGRAARGLHVTDFGHDHVRFVPVCATEIRDMCPAVVQHLRRRDMATGGGGRPGALAALGAFPGADPVAVGPCRRAEFEFGVEASPTGPGHQREQFGADVADGLAPGRAVSPGRTVNPRRPIIPGRAATVSGP